MRLRTTALLLCLAMPAAASAADHGAIDSYVAPYAKTNNFSGVVLIASNGRPVYSKAFGLADREAKVPNSLQTRFHIASMSMQFTAAAVLRLVDSGKLALDTPVDGILPGFPRGKALTIRNLLTQTSGIADINELPDYDQVLQSHQTPDTLVAKVRDLPPAHAIGSYEHEEHSAYNLLALILEKKTGLPFAKAVRKLVFDPLGMRDSGIDDDTFDRKARFASGYAPDSVFGLTPAKNIHWSAKAGNGSAYSTAGDELRWITGLFDRNFLSPGVRNVMFDQSARVGYGWFKFKSRRFGETIYSMNGRAPGFASAIDYLPDRKLAVVVLSNIYASVPTTIGDDLAALMINAPYERLALLDTPPEPSSLGGFPVSFRYSSDFYRKNALIQLQSADGEAYLRWPSGDRSALIPVAKDRYLDRSYWVPVEVVRDPSGKPVALKYDKFIGQRE